MSNNKMLIDAAHPEETRVVVLRDGRVEEFDYESAARKLLRGNIYLAKVTRVEPSLQAAFVDYGGNRHGFLAFNEIHPDYYQIPIADREALKQEEADAEAAAEAAAEARAERRARQSEARQSRGRSGRGKAADMATEASPDTSIAQPGAEQPDIEPVFVREGIQPDSEPAVATPIDGEGAEAAADDAPAADTANDTTRASEIEDHAAVVSEPVDKSEAQALADAAAGEPDAETFIDAEADQDHSTDDDNVEADDDDTDDDDDAIDASADDGTDDGNGTDSDAVEEVGSEDAIDEVSVRPRRRARQYKIQEVIKRRQVLLVQVVKEERGNKGAALTTYLSLAGRYTVLMPNTGRGGGISRKIANPTDRKRLKAIANELEVSEGMGLIIRTAGAARNKEEIERDFEYLLRLWESVRELTLDSTAPNLVYEEGNLIKRSIRDLYSKEVTEICVAGEQAYTEAKDFMGMLMPSHAKNVIAYNDPEPLFAKYPIERQLNAMFSPYVTLKSGGYIVINQTEALVSVDVNSGKSTREFSIEETALKTNLEASEELARQLKLRDLAGLIVIDYIDMEEKRNNRAVERKIKECLKNDRARIQVGRISHFGLLEMSRQRMRTGVLEGSTTQCPHCTGTGVIRSTESVALGVLRALEDALIVNPRNSLTAATTATVALYILNNKRAFIDEMEQRYGVSITIEASDKMQGAAYAIEKSPNQTGPQRRAEQRSVVDVESGFDDADSDGAVNGASANGDKAEASKARVDGEASADVPGEPKKRRRRRRRKSGDDAPAHAGAEGGEQAASSNGHDAAPADSEGGEQRAARAGENGETGEDGDKPRRRRRGRRGGRRNRGRDQNGADSAAEAGADELTAGEGDHVEAGQQAPASDETHGRGRGRSSRRDQSPVSEPAAQPVTASVQADEAPAAPLPGEAYRSSTPTEAPKPAATAPAEEPAAPPQPTKKGWWQRAFGE